MARRINFARNPLDPSRVNQAVEVSQKVRAIFTAGGSSNIHQQSTLNRSWIRPSPTQPRQTFDPQLHSELVESIRQHGILEPIVVRLKDDHYEIVCGERRFRAATEIGLAEVPVTVRDFDDQQAYLAGLHENIQRANLTPIEEANAYKHLLQSSIVKDQTALAKTLGISQSRIAQKLALLELPKDIQAQVRSKPSPSIPTPITERHARAIRQLPSVDQQREVSRQVVQEGLSVAQTEARVSRSIKETSPKKAPAPKTSGWVKTKHARYRSSKQGLEIFVEATTVSRQLAALQEVSKRLQTGRCE